MKKGIFICFTGIDGSGKTTLTKSLEESLNDSGLSCKYSWCGWRRFETPLFKPIATLVKKFSKNKRRMDDKPASPPMHNSLLFYAAWLDYVLRVFPSLLISLYKYDVVIVDRYIYDIVVGFSVNTGSNKKRKMNRILKSFSLFPKPNIVFFIDVPPELAYARKDDIPSVDYLSQQKTIYLELLKKYKNKTVILDGTKSKKELVNTIFETVMEQ
jgi:thymidylate kinase